MVDNEAQINILIIAFEIGNIGVPNEIWSHWLQIFHLVAGDVTQRFLPKFIAFLFGEIIQIMPAGNVTKFVPTARHSKLLQLWRKLMINLRHASFW